MNKEKEFDFDNIPISGFVVELPKLNKLGLAHREFREAQKEHDKSIKEFIMSERKEADKVKLRDSFNNFHKLHKLYIECMLNKEKK